MSELFVYQSIDHRPLLLLSLTEPPPAPSPPLPLPTPLLLKAAEERKSGEAVKH